MKAITYFTGASVLLAMVVLGLAAHQGNPWALPTILCLLVASLGLRER